MILFILRLSRKKHSSPHKNIETTNPDLFYGKLNASVALLLNPAANSKYRRIPGGIVVSSPYILRVTL